MKEPEYSQTDNNKDIEKHYIECLRSQNNSWWGFLLNETQKDYFTNLSLFLKAEQREEINILPSPKNIFKVFEFPIEDVKVVILGQDPYPTAKYATGLAFSVPKGEKPARSLQNILKEVAEEFDSPVRTNGDLTDWANQGVFLLNTILTVEEGKPGSHKGIGWENLTDNVISLLNNQNRPIVFMLWGKEAQKKEPLITNPQHLILKAPHPSPYSARSGFLGCGHFKKANDFLAKNNITPIKW